MLEVHRVTGDMLYNHSKYPFLGR